MEPKQVFRAYDGGAEPHVEDALYCLACGSELSDRLDGDTTRRVCVACGFVRYRNPAPGVAVLVVEGERILLCRRAPTAFEGGRWCLPCGYVEYDEDFLTAAAREVEEETGLVVQIDAILSVSSNFLAPAIHTVVTVLLARPAGGELQAGDDVDLARWFAYGEELPDLAFESDGHIIERYFSTRVPGAPVERL